jgi:hypothetical protein
MHPDIDVQSSTTAIVFIDPQNDVLSEKGTVWSAVEASVKKNNTVENMERLFKAERRSRSDLPSVVAPASRAPRGFAVPRPSWCSHRPRIP